MPLDASGIMKVPSGTMAPEGEAEASPFEPVGRYLATLKTEKVRMGDIEEHCGGNASLAMALLASLLALPPMVPMLPHLSGAALLRYTDELSKAPVKGARRPRFAKKADMFSNFEVSVADMRTVIARADLTYRYLTLWNPPGQDTSERRQDWRPDGWRSKLAIGLEKLDSSLLIAPGPFFHNTFQSFASLLKLAALHRKSTPLLLLGSVISVLTVPALIFLQGGMALSFLSEHLEAIKGFAQTAVTTDYPDLMGKAVSALTLHPFSTAAGVATNPYVLAGGAASSLFLKPVRRGVRWAFDHSAGAVVDAGWKHLLERPMQNALRERGHGVPDYDR